VTAPDEYQAACLQFDVTPGDVAQNVAAMQAGVEEAAGAAARLCVLPELWATSFLTDYPDDVLSQVAEADEALRLLSEQHKLVVVGSSIEQADGGFYNTARVWQRGEQLASYRKIHLFSPNHEHLHHLRGDDPCLVDTELGRIGLLICYDLRFPELARYYFHHGAEVLCIPGQWPEARAQHWRTLLRARAIENEVFVVGCNRTGQEPSLRNGEPMSFPGDGRIIDPTGEILATGNGDAGAVIGPIELRKVRTMRRILPVAADQRPDVYRRLLADSIDEMTSRTRDATTPRGESLDERL